jgi:hypothetical protein
MGLLDSLIFGVRRVLIGGAQMPDRQTINFDASTFTVTDNPGAGRLDVTVIGGGGGGGGATLPSASLPNSVLVIPVGGSPVAQPLTFDMIGPAFVPSLAGGIFVDVGTVLTTPALTASYTGATPTSAILSAAALSGATATGNVSKDVSSTPTSFTAAATITMGASGSTATYSLTAHGAATPTKTSNTTSFVAVNRNFYGLGDPDMGATTVAGASTGRSASTIASFILGLTSSALATSGGAFTVPLTAPTGKKMYAARRTAYGAPAVFTDQGNGFKGGWTLVASSVPVPRNGVTENFDMYETNLAGIGAHTFGVA